MSRARRGEVYSSDEGWPGERADFLIISCDEWNARRVREVLGLQVVEGVSSGAGLYATVGEVGGQVYTVYADQAPAPTSPERLERLRQAVHHGEARRRGQDDE